MYLHYQQRARCTHNNIVYLSLRLFAQATGFTDSDNIFATWRTVYARTRLAFRSAWKARYLSVNQILSAQSRRSLRIPVQERKINRHRDRLAELLLREIKIPSRRRAFRGDVSRSLVAACAKRRSTIAREPSEKLSGATAAAATTMTIVNGSTAKSGFLTGREKRARREDVCSSYVRLLGSLENVARKSGYYVEKGSRANAESPFSLSFSGGETYRYFIIDRVCTSHSQYRTKRLPVIGYTRDLALFFLDKPRRKFCSLCARSPIRINIIESMRKQHPSFAACTDLFS